jgi:hypothetical protein
MCAGFPADGEAHHLVNRTDADVVILEIGDGTKGDCGSQPAHRVATASLETVSFVLPRWRLGNSCGVSYGVDVGRHTQLRDRGFKA